MKKAMKRVILALFALAAIAVGSNAKDVEKVYMLHLDDEIGSTTWQHTREALKQANAAGADLFFVHLNTYGGSVQHADSIRTALLHCPMPTVAFVDNNAASAGALIALACDSVFMRDDATMGAVTVVNGADGAAMPDKYQSYMRAMMRATAESHGRRPDGTWRRDPLIAEAMVDPRVTVPGLIDSTRVLTFTAGEALRWGYSDGYAQSADDVLGALGIDRYTIDRYEPTWVDALLGFFTNPAVQGLLIMLIIGGIYYELQSPGMGFPSVVAIMAAALYFLPLYLTGITGSWLVILFLAGLLLILLEVFVVPGFGVTGIAGIICVAASLFIGLLNSFGDSEGVTGFDTGVIARAGATFVLSLLLGIALIIFLSSRRAPKAIALNTRLNRCQRVDEGYIGVDKSIARHVGQTATAVTDMHPGGKIRIGAEMCDAVSTHGFIEKGSAVKVVRHENAQLYVEPAEAAKHEA